LLHIVRSAVGDSAFRNALKLVFKRFQYRTFTMGEFISTLEEGCGQSLRWWREEWLGRKGVPAIAMNAQIQRKDSQYSVVCTLEQLRGLYRLPLTIGIESSLGLQREKVLLNEKQMTFTFESKEEPKRILLDPEGWVLMNVASME
jgi:aminopeptidase N